jgi:hypothetical protein
MSTPLPAQRRCTYPCNVFLRVTYLHLNIVTCQAFRDDSPSRTINIFSIGNARWFGRHDILPYFVFWCFRLSVRADLCYSHADKYLLTFGTE